jgi:5-methylcytosine-specific restriction endonuclease McrA
MGQNHKRKLILAIVASDRTFDRVDLRGAEGWQGKCIHCNAHLQVAASGEPISKATIEHIVPQAHGGTDDLVNLALACSRCNHQKGVRHDNQHASDPKLQEVVARLQQRRRDRWREPESDAASDD